MSTQVTRTEFIERLRKSGLCTDARFEPYFKKQSSLADAHAEPIAVGMVRGGLLTDFQARQILGGIQPDFFIGGKYRILELLGRGGMGSVFLCEHLRMRRLVAVKVLPKECESDPDTLARFEREAQAVAAFDHPNVVHAYDIDQAAGRHFLVMEFVDGIDLQSFVTNHGALSPARAAWCIAQTARGLHHAWLAGWVHRDIKPGNLLLDRGGSIKILDMGLARIFNDASANVTSLFQDGCILGTADYLSPEQASGGVDPDIRGDIYSLGATFYFLLAGKAPFEDCNVSQKLLSHRTLNPLPIRERRPDVPEGMAAILARLLEKDPRNRYATPGELADALLPFCTPPPPPPSVTEMPTWSPAVAERIRACQAPSERIAPQTVPLYIKPAPKTELKRTGKIVKPTQLQLASKNHGRFIAVPRWLALSCIAVILGMLGWIIYRELHPAGLANTGRPVAALTLSPGAAEHHIDDFAFVAFTVGAEDHDNQVFLYASPSKAQKGFFVVIDREAIRNGRFGSTAPERIGQEFVGKHLLVLGRLVRHDDDPKTYRTGAPYVKVVDPKQIQIQDQ